MTATFRVLSTLLTSTVVLVGCSSSTAADPSPDNPGAKDAASSVEQLTVEVTRTLPHDRTAFTQGLEVSGSELFESTGRNGSSWIRVSDLDSGAELRRADLSADYFGEGLTVTDDIVWQITWRDGVAIARDLNTLAEARRVEYEGEGWGLCNTPEAGLVMSDGSETLTFRDPVTFAATSTVEVSMDGEPLADLNELECAADGSVYANVWQTHDIARIDPKSGEVTALIDAAPLWDSMTADERAGADVLNGIAQLPGAGRFLVTGKLWPTMYEVEFTPPR
ncbi:MAG: glutaminyl-peptide cyclotransferase [Rhodococcus sp. (in: high G+C Gram-positive bacteria)]